MMSEWRSVVGGFLTTNYTKGRSREYQAMHKLRSDGWVCSRSAMSHGPIDVFAAKDGNILLIQVKSGSSRIKKIELQKFRVWAEHFNASAEIWYYKKRGKLQRHSVRKQLVGERVTISVPNPL
jgi:Holliday junction resolvase